jgi:TPR repeat protein
MNRLTAILCLTLAVLLGSAGGSESADFQKGMTAARSGDYATALREWKPLAEQGYARAQSILGEMYQYGRGVPQDDKTAVEWYRFAEEQGSANAYRNGHYKPRVCLASPNVRCSEAHLCSASPNGRCPEGKVYPAQNNK